MNFIKIRTLPDDEEQLINLDLVKRIAKVKHSSGEVTYELILSGSDIKVSRAQAKKIFEIVGVSL